MQAIEFLSYGFVQRALIAGVMIAVIASVLGVFLVLRRLSLIGDGLSHVSFSGIALGLLLGANPLYVSVPVVVISSLAIFKLSSRAGVYSDAAIGMVSALGIAGGVILSSFAGGFNVDLFSYLFGSILSITTGELWFSVALCVLILICLRLFYHELVCVTFDSEYARVLGINTKAVDLAFVIFSSVAVVLLLRVAGIMLVSALLIIPAAGALQVGRGFRSVVIVSCVSSIIAVLTGIYVSFALNLPSGATIVLINLFIFLALYLCGRLGLLFKKRS